MQPIGRSDVPLLTFEDRRRKWMLADIMHGVTRLVEVLGVLVILAGIALAGWRYVRAPRSLSSYRSLRGTMGRAILLGLELMVAADIIYTVAVQPTLQTVLVLGLIVLIRTFLSLSLEVEISGHWPWAGNDDERSLHRGKNNFERNAETGRERRAEG
jgi:uncharacterized membrane protein